VSRAVTAAVPIELDKALVDQGITFMRGQVLLACTADHEIAVLRELRRIVCDAFRGGEKGICLVTYAPQRLSIATDLEFDYIIALAGDEGLSGEALGAVEAMLGTRVLAPLPTLHKGQGLLVHLGNDREPQVFDLGSRWVRHVRHWHKHAEAIENRYLT